MSARCIDRLPRSLSLAASFLLSLPILTGCAKNATNPPGGTLSGHVALAAGQSGDVNLSQVQIYMSDPFAAGATPSYVVTATGSATDATFQSGDLQHGDFYIAAWKDNGDHVVGTGDLRGWYNGGVSGTGIPVAAVFHLLHGQNASITINVSAIPGPQTTPAGADARSVDDGRPRGAGATSRAPIRPALQEARESLASQ